MCTLPSTTFNLFFVLLSELNWRLPGGYPGWPRWLHSNTNYVFKDLPRIIPATTWRLPRLALVASFRTSLAPRISPGRIFHTHLPDAELWNFPGWLLPDPDSPETIQPNLSTLHLSADASLELQALTQVTNKSSDLKFSPYSLLLQSKSLSSWRIAYSLLLFLHTILIHSP
ncbi:hypothetical protein ATANTOWER_022077 [Ataeniobius toweri]|uniref:Uncharacterized protein n=1 Tax=Ataeniobius toweri TaxID=208326 RepID=A0ABU7B1N7_9TELE|nr:hypothetical protein [Ataeniobius toweri]